MTILSQTFFAFVSSHFVAFSFLSARHVTLMLEVINVLFLYVFSPREAE